MCLHREQLLLPFLSRGEEEAARSFCTLTLLQRDTTERKRENLFLGCWKRSSPYICRETLRRRDDHTGIRNFFAFTRKKFRKRINYCGKYRKILRLSRSKIIRTPGKFFTKFFFHKNHEIVIHLWSRNILWNTVEFVRRKEKGKKREFEETIDATTSPTLLFSPLPLITI